MSNKILNLRPPLTHLDLYLLFRNEENAQLGEGLLQTLASITQPTTLLFLNLGANKLLWKDQVRFDLLLDVLEL